MFVVSAPIKGFKVVCRNNSEYGNFTMTFPANNPKGAAEAAIASGGSLYKIVQGGKEYHVNPHHIDTEHGILIN